MLASWKWRSAPVAQVLVLGPLEVRGPAKELPTAHPGRISENSENSLFLGRWIGVGEKAMGRAPVSQPAAKYAAS